MLGLSPAVRPCVDSRPYACRLPFYQYNAWSELCNFTNRNSILHYVGHHSAKYLKFGTHTVVRTVGIIG